MSQLISGHPSSAPLTYHNTALDSTKALVFSGKGNLFGIVADNNDTAAAVFIQIFDAAAAADVTLGTTPPDLSIRLPVGGSVVITLGMLPIRYFSKGIVVAATTTRTGSTDTTTKPSLTLTYFKNI